MSDLAGRLAAVRTALGISAHTMANALGLTDSEGANHLREMELNVRPVSGPIEHLLRYMEQSVEFENDPIFTDSMLKVLPRWLDCKDLEDDESDAEIVMHTRWPRFYAFFTDDIPDPEVLIECGLLVRKLPDEVGLGYMVAIFIDQPTSDPGPVIEEAATLKIRQASSDLR